MDRRTFLKAGAAGSGVVIASSVPGWLAAAEAAQGLWRFGVASGDPCPRSVVIWTRVTPSDDATPGSGRGRSVDVAWEIATDRRFRSLVRRGRVTAGPRRDHTVKVLVGGLNPSTTYFYRFATKGRRSPVGRTKTAPSPTADIDRLRFGMASCSNFEGGYFSAYRHMAEHEDLDFVLHLGDYIYEYAPGEYGPGPAIGRTHKPGREMVTLSDYRLRHATYKRDPDLQRLHARYPFITTWDDHEVTNDTWRNGAENHNEGEGSFKRRRNAAYRAYFEWMPIRRIDRRDAPTRIYRGFQFGRLADLSMFDTRQYRDKQPANQADPSRDDPNRTLVGNEQMRWIKKRLARPKAQWRLVGNQVMIIPFEVAPGTPFNVDAWDGYGADRTELLTHIRDNAIDNVAFLTGDIHSSWAADVPINADEYKLSQESVAVEMVGTSITSDNFDEITGKPSDAEEAAIPLVNPHVKMVELDSHGYSICEVTKQRLQCDWYYISDREDPDATQAFGTAYKADDGTNKVSPANEPIG